MAKSPVRLDLSQPASLLIAIGAVGYALDSILFLMLPVGVALALLRVLN